MDDEAIDTQNKRIADYKESLKHAFDLSHTYFFGASKQGGFVAAAAIAATPFWSSNLGIDTKTAKWVLLLLMVSIVMGYIAHAFYGLTWWNETRRLDKALRKLEDGTFDEAEQSDEAEQRPRKWLQKLLLGLDPIPTVCGISQFVSLIVGLVWMTIGMFSA